MSTALLVTAAGASANVTSPAAPRRIGLPRTQYIQRLLRFVEWACYWASFHYKYILFMLKERRSVGRLFFNMGLPTLVKWRLYIETGPWILFYRHGQLYVKGKTAGRTSFL